MIETSRVFQNKKKNDKPMLKSKIAQQMANDLRSPSPKDQVESPCDESLENFDQTPVLTDEVNLSKHENQVFVPRNNFTFEPSFVLESNKATVNNSKRAFDSTKLNLHPMSPTSQAVSPRNQAPSPMPLTPTSPLSASCDNDYDELNKNSIDIKSLTLESN